MERQETAGEAGAANVSSGDAGRRGRFPLTDMPTWLMLVLVALCLPRTILADLGVVEPEGSLLYYFLALVPFAVWVVVAIARRTRKPLADFLVLGVLYAISLIVVHQILWNASGPGLGHNPPSGAVSFAKNFGDSYHDLAVRGYTIGISILIGVGTGLVIGIIALIAKLVRPKERTPAA